MASIDSSLRGCRVVVAGAGLAGLAAAHELTTRGAAVHVFEARDRLGGRVWTLRDDPIAPFHIEAGGELIDDDHQALRALAAQLEVPLVRVLRRGFGLAMRGDDVLGTRPGRLRVAASQQPAWRALGRALAPATRAFTQSSLDWNSSTAAAIARYSLLDVTSLRPDAARLRGIADALRGFYLADPDRLSALVAVEEMAHGDNPGRMKMYRVDGGADRLVDALERRVRPAIRRRHTVRAIDQDGECVRVAVEGPDATTASVEAEYFVSTVPAPLVLDWTFLPGLPAVQRRALQALAYGRATKVGLRFDTPWWRHPHRPRAYGTNLATGAVWDAGEDQRGAALLTLLAGGSASTQLGQLLRREGIAGLIGTLGWLGRAPAALGEPRVVCWEDDPLARGGYAYFDASFDPSWRVQLSRAWGRVVFAGEHTSRQWQGYMNGAVESGQRAAAEIVNFEQLRRWTAQAEA